MHQQICIHGLILTGPFNAKNFGTTISAWVVLADALEPFKTKGLENDSDILPYIKEKNEESLYNIKLQVDLKSKYIISSTLESGPAQYIQRGISPDRRNHTRPVAEFKSISMRRQSSYEHAWMSSQAPNSFTHYGTLHQLSHQMLTERQQNPATQQHSVKPALGIYCGRSHKCLRITPLQAVPCKWGICLVLAP